MSGQPTPLAEAPDWHPVHRANALLQAAMLSAAYAEPSQDRQNVESLSDAIASVMREKVSITYPVPLAARLDALAAEPVEYPPFDGLMAGEDDLEEDLPAEADLLSDDLPLEWDGGAEDFTLDDTAGLTAGDPLDPEKRLVTPQVHVQSLLYEFHRRQRHASLLVAGSIATAFVLTLGGLVLIASWTTPRPADQQPSAHSTSIVWQRPAAANLPAPIEIATSREAKGEPLLVPAVIAASDAAAPNRVAPQTILAASGREIAFGAFLPPSRARYLLIRGLPAEAKLSAGRDSGGGAWMVKGEHVPSLTLALGETAAGDYPIEVYLLASGDGPQARRNFVLRVEPPVRAYAAADAGKDWTSGLLGMVPSAHAAEPAATPADSAVLHGRAQELLDIGDIAGARLLLIHLAERGDGDAAYELARTFDREMLAKLGARGLDGDPAQARGWYQLASQDGNAKATERLKILASLSGTGPSD
jgi:hypothetical protein